MASLLGDCRESCQTCQSVGTFNRLNYDVCAYKQDLNQSVSPLGYRMSRYAYENCARCTYDGKQYAPFDTPVVEAESELKGLTRPATRCPTREYSPTCEKSDICTSTFDRSVPVIYPANLCPVVCSNLKPMVDPGYGIKRHGFCGVPQPDQEEESDEVSGYEETLVGYNY